MQEYFVQVLLSDNEYHDVAQFVSFDEAIEAVVRSMINHTVCEILLA